MPADGWRDRGWPDPAPTPAAHTHVEGDVTNLVADLAAKAAASHTHDHGAELTGLADDDHTIYLLADGTRSLTGNMSVSAGVTIDGVDIGAHTHSGAAGHGPNIPQSSVTGLGTMSTQAASSVTITGGSVTGITDLAVADGGTGASTAAAARSNLGAMADAQDSVWAYNSANISIANNTETVLTFDSELFDTNGIHSTSSNTSRLTCQTAGTYLIFGMMRFPANATGLRQAVIRLNGGTPAIGETTLPTAGAGAQTSVPIITIKALTVGDYVTLSVYQNSGGALNHEFAAAYIGFGMVRVSA